MSEEKRKRRRRTAEERMQELEEKKRLAELQAKKKIEEIEEQISRLKHDPKAAKDGEQQKKILNNYFSSTLPDWDIERVLGAIDYCAEKAKDDAAFVDEIDARGQKLTDEHLRGRPGRKPRSEVSL